MESTNKVSEKDKEALKLEAKKTEEARQKAESKKKYNLETVKYALELGLKKGAYSTLDEMSAIINSFNGLK
tara:strand:+ start:1067 stop:1279 length:213 start_codon:yes stop_codon:yes gene_type:complete